LDTFPVPSFLNVDLYQVSLIIGIKESGPVVLLDCTGDPKRHKDAQNQYADRRYAFERRFKKRFRHPGETAFLAYTAKPSKRLPGTSYENACKKIRDEGKIEVMAKFEQGAGIGAEIPQEERQEEGSSET